MLLSMSNHYQTRAPRRQNGAGWTLTVKGRHPKTFTQAVVDAGTELDWMQCTRT